MMLGMYANHPLGPAAENTRVSSSDEAFTDKQISMLDKCFDKFRAADYQRWEQIVKDILGSFESTWT